MTLDTAPSQVRPAPPRRISSLAPALALAVAIMVAGAATAGLGYGSVWGLIGAAGVLAALHLAKVPVTGFDRLVLTVGMVTSTVLATRVLPGAPETVDVLICLQFAGAWLPIGIASALVAGRHQARPSSRANTAILWVVGGVFAIPMAEALDILTPIDALRRSQEPIFGTGDYMIVALIVATLGVGTLIAAITRMPGLATVAAVLTFTLFAGATVGFSVPGLFASITGVTQVPNLWPPNFRWAIGEGTWWWLPSWQFGEPFLANPLIETIRIAITATVLGCLIALPVAFLASTLTAPNRLTYLIDKGFLNFVRTIPDLFWALIFVASIGFGPFAGTLALIIFSMSIMGKLLSETVDSAEPGPLEAAKAAGSSHFPAIRTAVLPQVLPNYVALSLYIFELNIRASAVLGIVGAGGIGRVIEAQRSGLRFDRILAVLIPIFVLVLVVEQISNFVRRKLV